MQSNNAITLSQLQQLVGNTIRMNRQLQGVWVVAELSDVRVAGGHCYMELIEKDSYGNTCAKTRAMIWAGTLMELRAKFYAATGRDIATGMKVMIRGSVNFHNLYGLSFTISDIDPSYTVGDLERLRREILERLKKEGVLDLNRNLVFPYAPQRVAVISASGAAGYGDFMNQIEHNAEGFRFNTHLFGAVMQGERTSSSVRAALDLVESTIDLWDCVVIIRGGGSTSDLNGFDDYDLAKAVATFPLPVVVGIGHERDRTVLDEIACVRCKTPTAVAAFLIDSLRNVYGEVTENIKKIGRYAVEAMRGETYRLSSLEAMLPSRVKSSLLQGEKHLVELTHAMERAIMRKAQQQNENVSMLRLRVERASKNAIERQLTRLRNIEGMLRVLSPENTLRRGYSITRVNGKAVRTTDSLRCGDVVETTVIGGVFKSEISSVEEEEK